MNYSINLEKMLKDGDVFDINESDLFTELHYLKEAISKDAKRANELFEANGWLLSICLDYLQNSVNHTGYCCLR